MNPISIYKFLKSKKGREIPVRVKLIHGLHLSKDELNIKGGLDLSNTQIEYLPDNLNVGGSLFLNNTQITSLPNNLKVRWNLFLGNTKIKSLPDNLSVGDSLYLNKTPLSKTYSGKEIRKMIEDKGGNVKRQIYL